MRHQKKGRKFNRTASHRKAMMSNLASSLIIHKRIQTTDAKSKEFLTLKSLGLFFNFSTFFNIIQIASIA